VTIQDVTGYTPCRDARALKDHAPHQWYGNLVGGQTPQHHRCIGWPLTAHQPAEIPGIRARTMDTLLDDLERHACAEGMSTATDDIAARHSEVRAIRAEIDRRLAQDNPVPDAHFTSTPPTDTTPPEPGDRYTWAGIPGLIIEMERPDGGPNLTAINPWSGATVTLFDAFRNERGEAVPFAESLRQLGQAIQQVADEGGWHRPSHR